MALVLEAHGVSERLRNLLYQVIDAEDDREVVWAEAEAWVKAENADLQQRLEARDIGMLAFDRELTDATRALKAENARLKAALEDLKERCAAVTGVRVSGAFVDAVEDVVLAALNPPVTASV